MDLKSLSLAQRLLAGVGCVVVLALAAVLALLLYWERRATRALATDLEAAPAGWVDSLRVAGRLPDLGDLAATATDTGDGSWVVYDTARALRRGGLDHGYRALVGTEAPNAADSALWAAVAADTALDAWVAAARTTRWDATDRFLAMLPPDRPANIVSLPLPSYLPAREAVRTLVIRGIRRVERGDRAGARTDLAAATGLGARMMQREPIYLGSLVGRVAIGAGLTGWQRYAAVTGDTALGARATRLRAWASMRPGTYSGLLMAAPDSALRLARDSTLALGTRTLAAEQLLAAWLLRPRGLVFGPPRRVKDALAELSRDSDPDMARMAALAAATASRLHLFGLPGILREGGRPE